MVKINKIGILDPSGLNVNPLTNEPYSDQYKKVSKQWTSLPAYEQATNIIQTIKDNQVILVISGTGSGKTVLMPKFVLHALDYESKIAITLPKQIVAKSAAEYAALTLDVKLGQHVGYQYQGSDKNSRSDKTQLLYATDGSIVAQLLKDPKLSNYDAVLIDEAHERKVQIDFLLYLLRNTVKLRPEFKLIIMSATINELIFKEYFAGFSYSLLSISGKSNFPIESIFLPEPIKSSEFLEKGYEVMQDILKTDKINKNNQDQSHDILFFVTSKNEATNVCQLVDLDSQDGFCVEVYGGMDKEKEELAIDRNKYKEKTGKNRKLIIATNAAESSLTVDGLKYVIDSGFELNSYYDPEKDAKVLDKQLITHAQAKQRMGRAGRTEPGVCYHLYTKQDFDKNMKRYPDPSIRTSDITNECLKLLEYSKDVPNLLTVLSEFIEPPREKYIHKSLDILRSYNLIQDNKLTELGNIMNAMNLGPFEGTFLLSAKKFNCSREALMILSLMKESKNNLNGIFMEIPEDNANLNNKKNKALNKYKNKYGDHVALYYMLRDFIDTKDRKNFCFSNFMKYSVLDKAFNYLRRLKYSNQIMDQLKKIQVDNSINNMNLEERITKSVFEGYKIRVATKNGDYYDCPTIDGKKNKIEISRSTFLTSKPKQVVYTELFVSKNDENSNININLCSTII